ncbi:MAG: M1 family aminopeptidase [Ferruginibacter sp.]
MKIILIFIVSFYSVAYGQQPKDYCKGIDDIALEESRAFARVTTNQEAISASKNFDIKYYRCEWNVDPAIRYIRGKITVFFIITTSADNISFDLMNDLVVDSIQQKSSLLSFEHVNNTLKINFASQKPAGLLDSVIIFYQGVPSNTGFGSFVTTTHAGTPGMWTLSEPYGSRDWWPCKNGLDDKADSIDIIITSPSQYTAAANGLRQSIIIDGANKITHWKHRYPIASYLICMAITNYEEFDNSVQIGNINLPMQTFCYPESLSLFQAHTPLVLTTLQYYSNVFGDYPFINEKYGHVQFGWGGGQEHQTSTFIVAPNESLMSHELAHQWFGNKITCGSWRDIWLNEGFATHLASMDIEKKYPLTVTTNRQKEISNITSLPAGSVWVNDTTNVSRIFDGRLSYRKGSHLLYMLRWKLGDSTFFKGVRKYFTDTTTSFGFAKTDDFKRNLENVSGVDLTKFFDEWFYGEGYPSYKLEWSQIGNDYVKIKMNQITSHPSVSFFELPVALLFKNATQQKTIIVDNKFNGEVFFKEIGFIADTVIIDPEYWLITKNNTSKKVNDNIKGQDIVQVFPSPFLNNVNIYLRNFNAHKADLKIFDSRGAIVYKRSINVNSSSFTEINTQPFARGIYILKIEAGNSVKFAKKILKQ